MTVKQREKGKLEEKAGNNDGEESKNKKITA